MRLSLGRRSVEREEDPQLLRTRGLDLGISRSGIPNKTGRQAHWFQSVGETDNFSRGERQDRDVIPILDVAGNDRNAYSGELQDPSIMPRWHLMGAL